MQRVKTFDSTGVAPNGRLFAGDLNAIQDAAAALADLLQNIQAGSLAIGESGLVLSRFGAAEAQLSGHLRVAKILRGLEGILAGAFTTAQRDAIAVGGAPYGIVILNTTTNQYEWNMGTDGARNWQPLSGGLHAATHLPAGTDAIDWSGTIHKAGTLAAIPSPVAANAGLFYFATDIGVLYRSTGSVWVVVAGRGGQEVDFAQRTTNFTVTAATEATANTLLTGNSVVYDGGKVKISVHHNRMSRQNGNFGTQATFVVFRDTTSLGQAGGLETQTGRHDVWYDTPSAGSHTYSVKVFDPAPDGPNTIINAGVGGAGNMLPTTMSVVRL